MWNELVLSLSVCILGLLATGCAFTPKPVMLIEKPSKTLVLQSNNLKVAVVVRDSRPDTIQRAKLCGTMRNTYMMPTSVAFLAHKETLDVLTAKHISNILSRAGYYVVGTYPEVPAALSDEKLKSPPVTDKECKQARKINASEKKPEKIDNKEGLALSENYEVDNSSIYWTKNDWHEQPDVILDVTIDKFNSDSYQTIVTVFTQGWCDYKLALRNPDAEKRTVVWGQGFKGMGTSGPRAVIAEDCYIMALNMAYWNMMGKIEENLRTDDFKQAVVNASGL